jgi:RNase P subunit RPR2
MEKRRTCEECTNDGTYCKIRYMTDLFEFDCVQWLCPQCDSSYVMINADFTCKNCGFTYVCE